MKKFMKSFALLAVAALGLSACNDDKLVPDNGNADGKFVTVHFGAEASIEGATKAALTTEDEKTFKSAWENGDVLSVEYSNDNTPVNKGIVPATWTADHFDATLPKHHGMWDYNVVYPAPDAESKVDFGSARTQKGNAYNSKYDLMKGSATAEGADAGMTADGKNVVFNMTRQTAIAYFHLTSTLDEEVVSAKLSVEGGNIASSLVKVSGTDYSKGFDLSLEDLNEITITFTEAPTAKDMRLWFNVLPTTYTKMTLTVETATKTFTISKNTAGEYVAGKLYKVSKAIANEKWESKYSAKYHLLSDATTLNDGDKITFVNQAKSIVAASTITSDYFKAISGVTFNTDKSRAYMPESDFLVITIKSNGDGWLFENADGKYLKLTATKTGLSFADKGTTWTISIDNNSSDATISGQYGSSSSSLQWNTGANPMRLSNYTSTQSAVYIYVVDDPRTALDTPENLSISNMTLSWNAVPNAKEYKVTIGSEVATVSETSYTLSLEADYYNVSVIAVAEEGSAFKNSVAATLTDAKFGTPTLATPTLKGGAVDEFSVNTTWTVDSRATAGYKCELYNGETKVGDSKTVSTGSVTFDGLDDGVTYTVKVNAIAVEGAKAYAASDVAKIDLTTKGTTKISDINAAGTYTVKNAVVYAVANTGVVIIGDGTGLMLLEKNSHGYTVGDTFSTVAGTVDVSNGIWQFNSPTVGTKTSGSAPDYGTPIEATSDYLASKPNKVVYVHARGSQSGRYITVGTEKLYMSKTNTINDGKDVDAYGFIYGYSTQYSNTNFCVTSIAEDPTAPKLSVTPTSKTWASDEIDAAVFTVTTNAEGEKDWSVTYDAIEWATIAVDKTAGKITVTPNGENTTENDYKATLTVSHAAGTLSQPITLIQKSSLQNESYEVSGTLASWDFTSSSYPENKTNYANNGSEDLAEGTFYLNGTGSTWNTSKGYAFTAVTNITITVKATKALKKGAKITFSMDTYYNKDKNAPMKGFNLTAAEGATASTTGLSVTSFSLSSSSATKSVVYTLQNDVSAGSTVKLILTQTGKAGAGQGYIDNIKAEYTAE